MAVIMDKGSINKNVFVSFTARFMSNFYAHKICVGGSAFLIERNFINFPINIALEIISSEQRSGMPYSLYQDDLKRMEMISYATNKDLSAEDLRKRTYEVALFQISTANKKFSPRFSDIVVTYIQDGCEIPMPQTNSKQISLSGSPQAILVSNLNINNEGGESLALPNRVDQEYRCIAYENSLSKQEALSLLKSVIEENKNN